MPDNTMPYAFKPSQRGAALIVSLLFLLILTIIGLSSLSNSGLEARMAHNFQLKNTVFHAAESSIDTIIFRGDKGSFGHPNPTYSLANDKIEEALNDGTATLDLADGDLDPDGFLADAALTSTSTVTYLRLNEFCRGGGSCFEYNIAATANINATSATATHNQGISVTAPEL
jgi:type IV pilus assembly protein PilX